MEELVFFFIFAAGAVAGSLGVLLNRNPVNSAISLVVAFFFLAGIYVLLSAHFLAVIQILVYAGAIMVVFIFVLMLLNLREEEYGNARYSVHKLLAVFAGAVLLVTLGASATAFFESGTQLVAGSVPSDFGGVDGIGRLLLTKYVLPFEMAAVLLLVGIVGAVVVAKRRA